MFLYKQIHIIRGVIYYRVCLLYRLSIIGDLFKGVYYMCVFYREYLLQTVSFVRGVYYRGHRSSPYTLGVYYWFVSKLARVYYKGCLYWRSLLYGVSIKKGGIYYRGYFIEGVYYRGPIIGCLL